MLVLISCVILKELYCDTNIEKARIALEQGKYSEAISHYDKEIRENPKNYFAYYLRGYLFEVTGKVSNSLHDFSECIKLNPSFEKAKLNRASIYIKNGDLDAAITDLKDLHDNKEYKEKSTAMLKTVNELKINLEQYNKLIIKRSYEAAIEIGKKISELIPFSINFKRKHIDVLETVGHEDLIDELKSLSQLLPNDFELQIKLTLIFFNKGLIEEASNYIRKCLTRDPDHAGCKKEFKKIKNIKKIEKNLEAEYEKSNFNTVIGVAKKLADDKETPPYYVTLSHSYLCKCNFNLKKYKEAVEYCNYALEKWPSNVDELLARAESYEKLENYEDAKSDYNSVLEKQRNNKKASDGLRRIENLLKRVNRPDYYKILNVSKSASTQEINKSYRKLVKKYHPDHQRDQQDIDDANKKLQELNRARQVLTDADHRQRYDDGFDPLDPDDQSYRDSSDFGDSGGSFFNFFRGGEGGGNQYRFFFG